LNIESSAISNNHSTPLGITIFANGTTTIRNSSITDNSAEFCSGIQSRGVLAIDRTLIANNTGLCGGLTNSSPDSIWGGRMTVTNSSVINNASGVFTDFLAITNLSNVTITRNGTGISEGDATGSQGPSDGVTNLRNTNVALNTVNCAVRRTPPVSQGNNLSNDASCNLTAPGDKPNTPHGFATGALANNGGPTQTIALAANSPAVDAGSNAAPSCAAGTFDQRGTGFPRVLDGNGDGTATCDIGAYELAAFVQSTPVPTAVATAVPPTPFVPPPIPQVFQNPGAIAAVLGNRPASTPTQRAAVLPAAAVPVMAQAPVISPPRTGDTGLR